MMCLAGGEWLGLRERAEPYTFGMAATCKIAVRPDVIATGSGIHPARGADEPR